MITISDLSSGTSGLNLAGFAAIITALSGAGATILASKVGKREERTKGEDECAQKVKELRREAEYVAEELHQLKMRRYTSEG